MTNYKTALIQHYLDRKAIASGTFTLASGKVSDFYVDGRLVTTFPPALRVIAAAMKEIARTEGLFSHGANLVVPAGVGGIPIGTVLALELNDVPFVIDRGAAKDHGMGKRFEGRFGESKDCVVVDDLVTAGGTILKTVNGLRDAGYNVTGALVVVDREEGGSDELAKLGVKVHALLTKTELKAALALPR